MTDDYYYEQIPPIREVITLHIYQAGKQVFDLKVISKVKRNKFQNLE